VAALGATVLTLGGCGGSSQQRVASEDRPALVRVPADAKTLQQAIDRVASGGMVLVSPGTYQETAIVSTKDVTVRGTDRNGVVIDGGGIRPYGIVGIADGVRVQNLTVRNTTFYGVLVTGLHDKAGPRANADNTSGGYETFDPAKFPPLQRFEIDHVTAYDNGLYGIYAFNSEHGTIHDNYASGSADSGFYVGQCHSCDVLVTGNIGERNAVGFENANASAPLYVVGNRFSDNRVGMTFLSDYQEVFIPQKGNVVAGNLIADNNATATPVQADGGYGIGIGVSGGTNNTFARNRITGNTRAGLVLANTNDLPAIGNRISRSVFAANGVDIAGISSPAAPATGTCLTGGQAATSFPKGLLGVLRACTSGSSPAGDAATLAATSPAPDGISFLDVTAPGAQPGLADPTVAPGPLPASVTMPSESSIEVPSAGLLADLALRR
jgi:parallel beta-helix repeat protein